MMCLLMVQHSNNNMTKGFEEINVAQLFIYYYLSLKIYSK
jgi:hypothetical protein